MGNSMEEFKGGGDTFDFRKSVSLKVGRIVGLEGSRFNIFFKAG